MYVLVLFYYGLAICCYHRVMKQHFAFSLRKGGQQSPVLRTGGAVKWPPLDGLTSNSAWKDVLGGSFGQVEVTPI